MCLSVPGRVIKLTSEWTAEVEVGGTVREVGVQFVPGVKEGDYVLVHTGFAMQIIDEAEAEETLKIMREWADAEGLTDGQVS